MGATYKVVRVKNTHDPATDGFRGGYRSILVNFVYEAQCTWRELFGGQIMFDLSNPMDMFTKQPTMRPEEYHTHTGLIWTDYLKRKTTLQTLMALQGLQHIS